MTDGKLTALARMKDTDLIVLHHTLTCENDQHSHKRSRVLQRYAIANGRTQKYYIYTPTYFAMIRRAQGLAMIVALDRICAIYHLSSHDIIRNVEKNRWGKGNEAFINARQTAAYVLRSYALTHLEIGAALQRKHSTIISNIKRAKESIRTDPDFAYLVTRAIAKTESLLARYRNRDLNIHGKPLAIDWRSLVTYAENYVKPRTHQSVQCRTG